MGRVVRVCDRVEARSSCMGIGARGEVDGSMMVGWVERKWMEGKGEQVGQSG